LESLISLGCQRVLTSGQQRTAVEGKKLIEQLHQKAKGRIIIMPGGGVDEFNMGQFEAIGIGECHVSARMSVASGMAYRNQQVYMGGELRLPEYEIKVADPERLKKITGRA